MSKRYVIGISGGSGAGKTTLARQLSKALTVRNFGTSIIISEDSYYKDNSDKSHDGDDAINFDDISTKDHDLLVNDLKKILSGAPVRLPMYDFATHSRIGYGDKIDDYDFYILEGLTIFANDRILNQIDFKIFIDIPDDIRILRRIARDTSERGRSVQSIIDQYLRTVRPMHYLYTYPTRVFADFLYVPTERDLVGEVRGLDFSPETIDTIIVRVVK